MNTNRIVVWAGSDLYSIITFKQHTSAKSLLDQMLPGLEDDFGRGVKLNKVAEDKYVVNVDGVEAR